MNSAPPTAATDRPATGEEPARSCARPDLRYDTPQRIAAIARAGFNPTPAKRRLVGGAPAAHYAVVNGAPAILFVLGDHVVGAVTSDIVGGRIATVRGIAAPTRLTRIAEAWRKHDTDAPLITTGDPAPGGLPAPEPEAGAGAAAPQQW
ncbi:MULTISPECIES: hypothetical protein [unclassified Kitasatospora]